MRGDEFRFGILFSKYSYMFALSRFHSNGRVVDSKPMKLTMKCYLSVVLLELLAASAAFSEEFGGVEFPQGSASFADKVVSYTPSTPGPTHPDFIDPLDAIGAPDYPDGGALKPGSVSLGQGGIIVLEFTNNFLTGSDDSAADLYVFEVGNNVEDTFVEISVDGVNWVAVGKVFGSTSSIDIDAFGFSSADQFRFVRLTDDPNEGAGAGSTFGADIDAVGAISTNQVVDSPPVEIETAILLKFESALGSSYTIQESTDLDTWSDKIEGIAGTGEEMKFFFEATIPKKFYRLKPPTE